MTWCEECGRSTLELCDRNLCRTCCRQRHRIWDCDRYEGEWMSENERRERESGEPSDG